MPRDRIVPLIIAIALFMENMDLTVIAPAFLAVAAISALSVFIFARLPPEAAEMADRFPAPAEPSDQRAG